MAVATAEGDFRNLLEQAGVLLEEPSNLAEELFAFVFAFERTLVLEFALASP